MSDIGVVESNEVGFTPQYVLRDIDVNYTVAQLGDLIGSTSRSMPTSLSDIKVDFARTNTVTVEGDGGSHLERVLDDRTVEALGVFLQVPLPFLKRQDPEMQDLIVQSLLDHRGTDQAMIEYTDHSLQALRDPAQERVDPRGVIDIAANVLGDDALVVDAFRSPTEYRFDVLVWDRHDDPGRVGKPHVNDITRAGLSFGQNTRSNLTPFVHPYMMRLVCTNGMTVRDAPEFKLDGRGKSVEEVMADLEVKAEAAFSEVERQITALDDMRNQSVGDLGQAILRMGREEHLSDRLITSAIATAPVLVEDPEDASLFDLVNVLTNLANHPDLEKRVGARQALEAAGGSLVSSHAARCPRCFSALT